MSNPIITVVTGLAGCGKTTWIYQQLANKEEKFRFGDKNIVYFSPGVGNVPIDKTRLATELPKVKVFSDGQEVEFFKHLAVANVVYIELGFYLELSAIAQILDNLTYHAVALVPPHLQDSEYHVWANEIVIGADAQTSFTQTKLWRVSSTGQVIDEDSLHELWYEITHGAYGTVTRAKGIFNVPDGRSLYADFVAGVPSTDFLELDLPRHLDGIPQSFSGLEVLGNNLDEASLRQTLEDCCLSEAAILHYQQQVKETLLEETQA
ncbi:GTP-binding protein [Chlorogloeopsis sp. ULAP02]|uniref:CobW family GTP-binding protein n=1 Tax=Chlorogloeopsis sp. ULAP02 TaxID=3107926 RepID=UPI003135539D